MATALLQAKLHPCNFRIISGKMVAIVAYILGAEFADPPIVGVTIDENGLVLARTARHRDHTDMIGSHADLERSWHSLLDAARLTSQERMDAEVLYATRIGFCGTAMA